MNKIMQVLTVVFEGNWIERKNVVCMADASVMHRAKFGLCLNVTAIDKEYKPSCIVLLEHTDNEEKKVIGKPLSANPLLWNTYQFYFPTYEKVREFCQKPYVFVNMSNYESFVSHITRIDVDGNLYVRICHQCRKASVNHLLVPNIVSAKGDLEKCAVCLDGMRAGTRNTIQLYCGHVFHTNCLPPSHWTEYFTMIHVNTSRLIRCPMCRITQSLVTDGFIDPTFEEDEYIDPIEPED